MWWVVIEVAGAWWQGFNSEGGSYKAVQYWGSWQLVERSYSGIWWTWSGCVVRFCQMTEGWRVNGRCVRSWPLCWWIYWCGACGRCPVLEAERFLWCSLMSSLSTASRYCYLQSYFIIAFIKLNKNLSLDSAKIK